MQLVICDDHPIFAESLAAMLTARGHDVAATATNIRQLPELVAKHHPHACIADLTYEGGPDQAEVLDLIEQTSTMTDVLVVSGMATDEARDEALSRGATVFASKGLAGTALIALLEGRSAAAPAVAPIRERSACDRYFLTDRELQVLISMMEGDSTARMAKRLGVQTATARSHVQSVLMKLGVHNRVAAVAVAVQAQLVRP
ncbi:MAG: two component transcriptional regulator, LuxR family [Acidimicrobiales bacterium]|nr:two component transcriptional regulator, LuxR family [Acidimicrobiales bacterium]